MGRVFRAITLGTVGPCFGVKVLAVIVTPPVYKSSGGVAAGLALTRALAGKVDIEVAMMGDVDRVTIQDGLRIRQFHSTNRLGALRHVTPRQLATALWTSQIPAYIQSSRPDIVHLHNPVPPLALLDVATSCRDANVPYVISSHGFVEIDAYASGTLTAGCGRLLLDPLVFRPFRAVVRDASVVCMLSSCERDMMRRLGVPHDQLAVVTNGVAPYFMETVSEAEQDHVRRRFHLSNDLPTFLFVGNHTKNKGLDILLQAMRYVTSPLRLVIAGAIRSPADRNSLGRKGMKSDRNHLVVTDHVSESELRALYRVADAFVFPTLADTLPLVVLEAMASGLPVIATNLGGIPCQVTTETGLLVPPSDPRALGEAMDVLAADPIRRRALGAAGRLRVQQFFDWNDASDAAIAVYRRVLTKMAGQ